MAKSTADLLAELDVEYNTANAPEASPQSQVPKIVGGLAVLLLIVAVTLYSPGGTGLDFGWRPDLVGHRAPEVPLVGILDGERFELEGIPELDAAESRLTFFGSDRRKVVLRFQCGVTPGCPQDQALSFTRPVGSEPSRGSALPPIIELWRDDEARSWTRNFTLVLKQKGTPDGGAVGSLYLCLTDADEGFLGGQFAAAPAPSSR